MRSASSFAPERFRCEVRSTYEGVVAVAPVGELDLETVDEVARALRDVRAQALALLVLDLRGLTFMDSTGLHLFLETDAWAREAGVQLTIVPGHGAVRRLLKVSGVDRVLRLVDEPTGDDASDGRDGGDPVGAGRARERDAR